MLDRYGDYFAGSDVDLDETLLEYCAENLAPGRSLGRKSAGPAVLAAARAGISNAASAPQPGSHAQPQSGSPAAPAASIRPPLSRQRRRTLAPGQVSVAC